MDTAPTLESSLYSEGGSCWKAVKLSSEFRILLFLPSSKEEHMAFLSGHTAHFHSFVSGLHWMLKILYHLILWCSIFTSGLLEISL